MKEVSIYEKNKHPHNGVSSQTNWFSNWSGK